MRIGITGSRGFNDFDLVSKFLDLIRKHLPEKEDLIVVSGAHIHDFRMNKNMIDATALQWANTNEEPYIMFPPKWKKHGKKAGILRNPKIVEFSDVVFSFWDKNSSGTKNTIEFAEQLTLYRGNINEDGTIKLNKYGKELFKQLGIEV